METGKGEYGTVDCSEKYEKDIKIMIKAGAFGINCLQGGPKVLTTMKNRDRREGR